METVEIGSVDIRLSHTRHQDTLVEKRLLLSIQEQDILDPLQVAHDTQNGGCVLIDGFKRYRCARKLGLDSVPVEYIGTDIKIGILTLLRREESKGITMIEQATLIEELHKQYGMSIYDIALQLGRSPSWVSLRLGITDDLSAVVREKIMSGAFPARAYLYGIKGFTRVNKIAAEQVDACVEALSGKHLSTRDLFLLSRAYFNGGKAVEQLITNGDVHRALRLLKGEVPLSETQLNTPENALLKDLKMTSATMNRLLCNSQNFHSSDNDLLNNVNLWCATILNTLQSFQTIMTQLYERTRPSGSRADTVSARA